MGLIASLVLDSIQRGQSSDRALALANQAYGEGSREAMFAQNAPEQFLNMYAKQFDPSVQMAQQKQRAALMLAGGGGPEQPQQNSNPIMQMTQPGMPQDYDAAMSGGVQQAMPQQQASPSGLSRGQMALLAISDPDKLNQLIVDQSDPKKQAEVQKTLQENQKSQKEANDLKRQERSKYQSALQEFDALLGPEGHREQGVLMKTIGQADPWVTGRPGWIARNVIGTTNAADFDANLDTIKSNAGLKALLDMKAGSPTGASGFGSLSGPELNLLTSKIASLNTNQSDMQLRNNLHKIFQEMDSLRGRLRENPPEGVDRPRDPINPPPSNPIMQATQQPRVIKFGDLKK